VNQKSRKLSPKRYKNPRAFKDFIFAHYVHFALLALLLLIGVKVLPKSSLDWPLSITIFGGILSLVFLVQKQRLEDVRLFKELFTEFNQRYNSLNEKLSAIIRAQDATQTLSREQIDVLYGYFNLCGEEYLFYKEGYILQQVWEVWVDGMAFFCKADPRIRKLWADELDINPYYGFSLEFLKEEDLEEP
jgi:hypothetical protein